MFNNKTLAQQISDFLNTLKTHKAKVNSKIAGLETETEDIKNRIANNTDKMVEFELAEDAQSADKLRKANRDLRLRVDEIEGEIASYRSKLESSSPNQKELEKIREAAKNAETDRIAKYQTLLQEETELKKQKELLEQKIKDKSAEASRTHEPAELSELRSLKQYIDPRSEKLQYYEVESFLRQWMNGESIEDFFKEPVPFNGAVMTHGPDPRAEQPKRY